MAPIDEAAWFSGAATTLGDRIEGAREASGMTQADLSRRLGVKLRTVQSWEEDQSDPRGNRMQMLAGMLNVSLRWLLTGEGDGMEVPAVQGDLSGTARVALADLSRMRAQMLELSQEAGRLEQRLRGLMRTDAA